jgi:hypothetical protein
MYFRNSRDMIKTGHFITSEIQYDDGESRAAEREIGGCHQNHGPKRNMTRE